MKGNPSIPQTDRLQAIVGRGLFRTTILLEHRTPGTWAVVQMGTTTVIERDKHLATQEWARIVEQERGWQAAWEGDDCAPDATPAYRTGYKSALDRMLYLLQNQSDDGYGEVGE